jgi:hypothetical protein
MAEVEAVSFRSGPVTGNVALKVVDITISPRMSTVCGAALHDQALQ